MENKYTKLNLNKSVQINIESQNNEENKKSESMELRLYRSESIKDLQKRYYDMIANMKLNKECHDELSPEQQKINELPWCAYSKQQVILSQQIELVKQVHWVSI